MPIQVYECPMHGRFEVTVSFKDDVPSAQPCPIDSGDMHYNQCSRLSPRIQLVPAAAIIKDSVGDHGLDHDAQQLAGEKLRQRRK